MPCRLRGTKNSVLRDYVLPDYTHIKRGYVKVSGIHCFKVLCSFDVDNVLFQCKRQQTETLRKKQTDSWSLWRFFQRDAILVTVSTKIQGSNNKLGAGHSEHFVNHRCDLNKCNLLLSLWQKEQGIFITLYVLPSLYKF